MGVWSRFVDSFRSSPSSNIETRAITSVPWSHGSTRNGDSDALHLIPFFACVRVLAEQISSLPLEAFVQRGKISVLQPTPAVIEDPATYIDVVTWKRQCVISLATRGNAYGFVPSFDVMGFPSAIEWLSPSEIYVDETRPTMPRYYWAGVEGYFEIPREQMLHIAWFTPPGRVKGLSPVSAFAASIGIGLAANDYGQTWFDNGGIPPATFKNVNKTVSPEQADEITDRLVSSIRRGRPLTYGNDWEFKAIEVNPEESQFIETMKLNSTQMAAIFGIPPELVGGEAGGSLTYNSPEMNGSALHKFTLNSWMTLIETCLSRAIPSGQFLKFNADGVTRADMKTRYEGYKLGIDAGFLTIDEVRQRENLPPLPKPANPAPVLVPVKAPNGVVPATPGSTDPQRFLPFKVV